MQVEPRVRLQPSLHVGMFVGGVIVQDHMHSKCFRYFTVDGAEKLEELLMPVPGQAGPDHLTGQHVQRGEQGGGAMALVVVGVCPERGGEFDVGRAC